MREIPEKYRICFIYLALTVTVLAVFWQVRRFEFISYDDNKYVTDNEHILSGLSGNNIKWLFTKDIGRWHPLAGITHMLDCELFGLHAGRHHLVNLLFHIANTLLLFIVLRQMTGAVWKSAFVGALFAIHPLHVESVAWISQRKDVLSTLFLILTIAAYFRYVKNRSARLVCSCPMLLFALGLMAKPMLITLPFVLLLLDYWPLNRFQRKIAESKVLLRLIWEKAPFFALSIISTVLTFFIQKSIGAVRTFELIPMTIRLANAVVSYTKYIEKMIWPKHLAVFYPYPENVIPTWMTIVLALLLLAITIWIILIADRYRYLFVGWFWYIGTLAPVIGLIQVGSHAMADRYTYLSLTGLFIIIAWGADDLLQNWRYRKITLGFASVLIIFIFSICAYHPNRLLA